MSRALDPNVSNVQVDALALAHGGAVWEAEFTTRRFPRLAGVAVSDVPQIRVRLQFGLMAGKPVVHGMLRGTMELICQRCMAPMQQPIDETFDLLLVESEAQFDSVPESHEPWLVDSALTDLAELVEEQLLLSIPIIAKHADESGCETLAAPPQASRKRRVASEKPASDEATHTQRPFANLRDMLPK